MQLKRNPFNVSTYLGYGKFYSTSRSPAGVAQRG